MAMLDDTSLRRFTAAEAMRMVDVGILDEDEHVQLLDGVLVAMSPEGPEHVYTMAKLADRLRAVYPGPARVREAHPVTIGAYSLPEPDIAVVRGQIDTYAHRH